MRGFLKYDINITTMFTDQRIYNKNTMKILSIVLIILMCGCGKNDDMAPVITITSPTDNQVFSGGQTVNIKASITDNEGIHMIHVSVIDNSTGGHLLHTEDHPDVKSYNVNQTFVGVTGRTYTIDIDANDHNENLANKEVNVSAN
ncbi:MAG: Ig-like domain-containing protein [Flavisolibacter sp.]|jgi:hypothetical protein